MALTANSKVTATDINTLKSDLNKEMDRRKHTKPLNKTYGTGSSYDFSVAAGDKVLISQYNNIITPLRAVNATTVGESTGTSGKKLAALNGIAAVLDAFEARKLNLASSDCTTACSGLCHTACNSGCRGCTSC